MLCSSGAQGNLRSKVTVGLDNSHALQQWLLGIVVTESSQHLAVETRQFHCTHDSWCSAAALCVLCSSAIRALWQRYASVP